MQKSRYFINAIAVLLFITPSLIQAQVNTVEFGKNRIQYKKMKWKFYQSSNFNTHVNQGGTELGSYVAQMAEEELASVETFMEYGLQKKANIFVYNSYDEFRQSNIGLGTDWQNSGGLTKLPNNKMVVYFDGNHNHLKTQIRQGIAQILLNNLLFGDDIGEVASNQAFLDLPKWLTDGYIAYVAENWSTENDNALRNAMLGADYKTFYHFAFKEPLLAGHSFWQFIAEKYKRENVTYFLYLARMYKKLNAASEKICKKKFKPLMKEFMEYEQDKYSAEMRGRRNAPKGSMIISEDITKKNLYRFQANPNPRNNTYVYVEFHKGIYSVKYVDQYYDSETLLSRGFRSREGDINPNYPILAWDVKGTKALCIYWEEGKTKMFVYDVIAKYKKNIQTIEGFDQILDANFMLDGNTLVLSATKNGHSDIYTYSIQEQKIKQITNDVYDDLNPTFVSFPNRSGIIYSSNRPSVDAPSTDTVLPSRNRFNIFLVDILNESAVKQITQLTNLKYGNATSPMQYNVNHFTFIADENGINNRWAGFFTTQRNGLDTLYYVGDELLHNPIPKDLDSTLKAWRKQEPDSISYFQVYKDSTYTFPITNYESSLSESRVAGNNSQVSETRQEGEYKNLYKLKVNEDALSRRNINAKPTFYMKKLMGDMKSAQGKATNYSKASADSVAAKKKEDIFQTGFENEKPDTAKSSNNSAPVVDKIAEIKKKIKLFNYRRKYNSDNLTAGLSNNLLVNRYQPYSGGFGPIILSNNANLNLTLGGNINDLTEDIRFTGGVRFSTSLKDKDFYLTYTNLKRRLDWGITYYRSTKANDFGLTSNGSDNYQSRLYTNIYQFNMAYPFSEIKSLRMNIALRRDRTVIKSFDYGNFTPTQIGLQAKDIDSYYVLAHLEYVHDNSINPAMNIWEGLRWKMYMDVNIPGVDKKLITKDATYNFGFDARHYKPLYRNIIWALRTAADFSWGEKKLIYYLGGTDGWFNPVFNDKNKPAQDQNYAFQTLAVNMRGYNQNIANGNNAFVINSEIRFPIFSTISNKPVNNAFLRNLQLIQFIDLGTAWNGKYNGIKRPQEVYTDDKNPVAVIIDAGGLGPFAGGYGFGARSTLLGYFMKFDLAWPMKGFFVGKPIAYFSLGLDF